MAEQRTVLVKYWTWCKWKWVRYPCRKTREETRWCYEFDLAQRRCFGFVEQFEACENGIEYHYTNWCFGWVPTWTIVTNTYVYCRKNELKSQGPCSISGTFPGDPDPSPGVPPID